MSARYTHHLHFSTEANRYSIQCGTNLITRYTIIGLQMVHPKLPIDFIPYK